MGTITNHAGLRPIPLTRDSYGAVLPASASGVYGPSAYAYDQSTAITAVDLVECYGVFGLQVNLSATAAPSAFSAQLQGSLDGLNWFSVGAALTATANGAQYAAVTADMPARYLRLNLSVTGGTNVAVTAWLGCSE